MLIELFKREAALDEDEQRLVRFIIYEQFDFLINERHEICEPARIFPGKTAPVLSSTVRTSVIHWFFMHVDCIEINPHVLFFLKTLVDEAGGRDQLTRLLCMPFVGGKTNALLCLFSTMAIDAPGAAFLLYMVDKWPLDLEKLLTLSTVTGDTLFHVLMRQKNTAMITTLKLRAPRAAQTAFDMQHHISPLWYAVTSGDADFVKIAADLFPRKMSVAVAADAIALANSKETVHVDRLRLQKIARTLLASPGA